MRLFIEPTEPLMFRTARPFEAGQNNFAESVFPPTPETLQGMIRAAIAAHWHPNMNIAAAFGDPKLVKLIGDRNSYGHFRLTGIALGRYEKDTPQQVERLFAVPAHIMATDNETVDSDTPDLQRLLPHPLEKNISSNWPEGMRYYLTVAHPPVGSLKSVGGWLTEADLLQSLGTEPLTGMRIIKNSEIFQEESRLGIGIQAGTKATEEGFLYQMLMIRMNHRMAAEHIYGFVIDINLALASPGAEPLSDEQIQMVLRLPSSGWLTLGAEQRTARFRVLTSSYNLRAAKTRQAKIHERMLLYLATPATFKTGWQPSVALLKDRPITAAINRYESIGGWKLNLENAGGENKVMRRYVPAGSVYFFDKGIALDQPLTDYGMEIGYGITYEGTW